MKTRRQFIQIMPIAGFAVLAACSKETPTPAAPAATAPAAPPAAVTPPVAATPPTASPAPAPAASSAQPATAGAMVDEKDAQAIALGYVAQASSVDKAKWKQFTDGSQCSNCSLYQGAAGSEAGGCGIFTGKQVAAKGWCSAFNKKA
jgi:High potential iron-sulfur protein